MNINEVVAGGGVVIVIMTLIQITPIRIDPWSSIARAIGRAINGEVIQKVEKLNLDLLEMKAVEDERDAIYARTEILRFGDELYINTRHTKERFNQILSDITKYEKYCSAHPDFQNDQAVMTITNIKETYQKCLEKHNFL